MCNYLMNTFIVIIRHSLNNIYKLPPFTHITHTLLSGDLLCVIVSKKLRDIMIGQNVGSELMTHLQNYI